MGLSRRCRLHALWWHGDVVNEKCMQGPYSFYVFFLKINFFFMFYFGKMHLKPPTFVNFTINSLFTYV